jgi:putative transposase
MAHTYTSILVHVIFSTKERRKQIPEEIQPRLWAYVGGIARTNDFKALAIGGTDDHVHVLLSIPARISVAKAVQLVKGGSSKWMHDELERKIFEWQECYAAFTIGISQIAETVRYIERQPEHHAKWDYEKEMEKILKRHGIVKKEENFSRP